MLQLKYINMKTNRIQLIISAAVVTFSLSLNAKENVGGSGIAPINNTSDQHRSVMALCSPATAQTDLDINNVRTRILAGGDMWWNLQNGMYFVPKPAAGTTGPTSLFAGSLWIGGKDPGGTLKVAAMTYRQTGNDFWPGPLDNAASTDATVCSAWDKHWKINRKDAEAYYDWLVVNGGTGANPVGPSAMDVINNWPVTAPDGHAIAPFYDINNNGIYEPQAGEVPDFDVTGLRGCNAKLFGDQCLFWVFNDKGNIHSETNGTAIGLEIHAQAFAFQTNDEINNMTFYRYKIINRSSFRLDSTYFGVWVDPDLGSANDDYVGCDVGLGLGFCYNGDLIDDNPPAGQIPYGINPPAIGVDFFEGPYADSNGVDDPAASVPPSFLNYGNGTIDDERIGMKKFVYYNNDNSLTGNPNGAVDVYNYLRGIWRDVTPITYGGSGHLTGTPCNYMFPGTSDPLGYGTNMNPQAPWDEVIAGNLPADRRFLQSAGTFTLKPGAVNYITKGVVWARTTQGGNLASVALMKGADAKAQKLFDRCFKTLDGPTAPNLAIQELNQELILTWSNPLNSNNYKEWYTEDDNPAIGSDSLYRFQGYMIYQLKDATVSASEVYNPDKARLVFQCDKKDQVKQIVNYTFDLGLTALVPQEMVNGADEGVVHSISIKDDKFATGNSRLVNHKTYYYAIIAYGYSPTQSPTNLNQLNDYLPFLAGRKQADGYFAHSAIPHIPSPEAGGTEAHSYYGTGPKLTRIEGQGNGGNVLDFTEGTAAAILSSPTNRVLNPTYQNGAGPVNIKVVDPLNVPKDNDFTIYLYDTITKWNSISTKGLWKLVNNTTGEVINSDKNIQIPNEQLINGQASGSTSVSIPRWGISVNVTFTYDPGNANSIKNGFLEATMSFSDLTKQWLTGIPDAEDQSNYNWIRSGTGTTPPDWAGIDNDQVYEKVLGGTWAPYRLTYYSATDLSYRGGAAWNKFNSLTQMKNLASVDVVFTSDKSKWTRCPVIEMQDETALAIGGAVKHNMRKSPSVDKNGLKAGDPGYNSAEGDFGGTQPMGMGWFPGYALNLETGERLNMAFGEDSYYALENGADMKWNPTSTLGGGDAIFGGKHYIYIFGHNGDKRYSGDAQMGNGLRDVPAYDNGQNLYELFKAIENTSGTTAEAYKREIYADAMWVNMPRLVPGHALLESTVHVRLRVAKPYLKRYATNYAATAGEFVDTSLAPMNKNLPMYTFNTKDLGTHKNETDVLKDALALINVVPNPYYAYSSYEKTALENLVKITNLPEKCTVTIYTLNGTLIRKFKKDDTKTSLDWDLKNSARIPIASGLYIIHVDVPGVGEKVLKWFGVLRPIDLDNY